MPSGKLFPICLKKGKIVNNQSYLFFNLNSVRQEVLENMYVWTFFFILFVLKIKYFEKEYKAYHNGAAFRF